MMIVDVDDNDDDNDSLMNAFPSATRLASTVIRVETTMPEVEEKMYMISAIIRAVVTMAIIRMMVVVEMAEVKAAGFTFVSEGEEIELVIRRITTVMLELVVKGAMVVSVVKPAMVVSVVKLPMVVANQIVIGQRRRNQ